MGDTCRQEDDIRMVLKVVELEDVEYMQQARCGVKWRAIVIMVMNLLGFYER